MRISTRTSQRKKRLKQQKGKNKQPKDKVDFSFLDSIIRKASGTPYYNGSLSEPKFAILSQSIKPLTKKEHYEAKRTLSQLSWVTALQGTKEKLIAWDPSKWTNKTMLQHFQSTLSMSKKQKKEYQSHIDIMIQLQKHLMSPSFLQSTFSNQEFLSLSIEEQHRVRETFPTV
jgi:hypothetical protein